MRFIYITCKDRTAAIQIGRALVRERLVACVNILDGMTSCYWWEGEVEESTEAVLIAKTTETHVQALIDEVKKLHDYEVPCVVSLPILEGNPDYLTWISESVS